MCTCVGCSINTQNNNLKWNIISDSKKLLGNWDACESSSEWRVFYPKLIFLNDSTMMITTIGDTIINCKYILKNDSLFFYIGHENGWLGSSQILKFTPQYLKLSNILSESDSVAYNKEETRHLCST